MRLNELRRTELRELASKEKVKIPLGASAHEMVSVIEEARGKVQFNKLVNAAAKKLKKK